MIVWRYLIFLTTKGFVKLHEMDTEDKEHVKNNHAILSTHVLKLAKVPVASIQLEQLFENWLHNSRHICRLAFDLSKILLLI